MCAGDMGLILGSGSFSGAVGNFAREIPWTDEPDGLQTVGLQRVGHD